MSYLRPTAKKLNPINTPVTSPIKGREKEMVRNSGGHYVFTEDPFVILKRFLILGTESSTMYDSAEQLTLGNTQNLNVCLLANPHRTIEIIKEVSTTGAGIKNDTAIFALAVAASSPDKLTRELAFDAIPAVCRTGTHFLMFVSFADNLRGWGTGFKNAVWNWYDQMASSGKLDYQLAKYRNREGWTHRDVLRLLHKPVSQMDPKVARLIGTVVKGQVAPSKSFLALIEEAKDVKNGRDMVKLLKHYPGASWEMLPTEALNFPEVWAHFLEEGMPYAAMVRNLNRMSANGVISPGGTGEAIVIADLLDPGKLKKSLIHPLNILIAQMTYKSGKSVKGSSVWTPNPKVVNALEKAFLQSFDVQEPTGKNFVVALDISGSMGWPELKDIPGLSPRVVTGVMSLALVKAETNVSTVGFSHQLVDLKITKKDTLESTIKKISDKPFGATNCALPVTAALSQKVPVDTFLVMTDNETNYGPAHAANELKKFRQEVNPKAKMIMAAMTATNRSIVDPKDPQSLSIAGFDPSLPKIVQTFGSL